MTIPRLVVALALLAAPLAAQLPAPPADSTLAAITARGRMLLHYDIAAWHGGDAFMALKPAAGEVNSSFARRNPDGSWTVYYGRLSAAKDTFYITYQATQVDADSGFTAARLATPLATTGVLREMALAFVTAQQHFGRVQRPYNAYIIPAPTGGFWVYLLPAQTDSRTFPLGGDVRYRITGGTTIVDSVRFHRAILERQTGALTNGETRVASVHTSFDSLPSESDVFVVLRQFPRLPELVATKNFTYQIDVDGTITWVRGKQTSAPITRAPAGPPMPTAVPAWQAHIDTVGSAPRTMSPSYALWRDTTTGWRLTFDRIITIDGADSGSYNGSWRTLLLPDGRFLVTRGFPVAAIQLYDASGHFVRDIGRAGNGADEFASTPTLAMKGDTLVAFDGISARVMLYTLEGQLIRSFHVSSRGAPIPIGVDPRGYVRVEQRFGLGPGDSLSRLQWIYYTTRGVPVDSIRRPPLPAPKTWRALDGTRQLVFPVPLAPAIADVFLPDGTLMYGVANRFEFFVTRNGHDTTRIFGRSDLGPLPIPSGFVDTTIDGLVKFQPAMKGVARSSDFPRFFPMWNSATVDDQGFVWVSSGLSGRTPASVSIFGRDGRYLGPAPLWWEDVERMSFGAGRMAYVTYDKDRRPVVRVYQVERRGVER